MSPKGSQEGEGTRSESLLGVLDYVPNSYFLGHVSIL